MTHRHDSTAGGLPELVQTALDRAQELADSDDRHATGWWQAAAQAGDMSILAVALTEQQS